MWHVSMKFEFKLSSKSHSTFVGTGSPPLCPDSYREGNLPKASIKPLYSLATSKVADTPIEYNANRKGKNSKSIRCIRNVAFRLIFQFHLPLELENLLPRYKEVHPL